MSKKRPISSGAPEREILAVWDKQEKKEEKRKFPDQCYRRINCKQHAVRAVRYNSDGQYCMTAGADKTIKLWNPKTGRLLSTYTGHGAEVADVRASGDNSQLASGGNDCTVCLWDVSTGNTLRRWRKHPGRVNRIMFAGPTLESFGPNQFGGASLLLSAGVDGMLLAWDVKSKGPYPVQKMHEAKDSLTSIAVNGHQIITGSIDKRVRIYDIRKGIMLEDYVGYPVTSVSISLDEQCLLVGCQDSHIRLFDATNGEILNKYAGHKNESFHIDSGFLNNDSCIYSGCEKELTKRVFFWDILCSKTEPLCILNHGPNSKCWSEKIGEKLPPQAVYLASTHFIHSVNPHPKKNRILTGGGDFIWEWGETDDEF